MADEISEIFDFPQHYSKKVSSFTVAEDLPLELEESSLFLSDDDDVCACLIDRHFCQGWEMVEP